MGEEQEVTTKKSQPCSWHGSIAGASRPSSGLIHISAAAAALVRGDTPTIQKATKSVWATHRSEPYPSAEVMPASKRIDDSVWFHDERSTNLKPDSTDGYGLGKASFDNAWNGQGANAAWMGGDPMAMLHWSGAWGGNWKPA